MSTSEDDSVSCKMIKKIWFILILCNLNEVYSMPKCCGGKNIFDGKCQDGGSINIAECGARILLEMNDNVTTYNMDQNNNLLENGTVIAKPKYFCVTTFSGEYFESILWCVDDEDISSTKTVRSVDVGFQIVSVFFIILTVWVYLIVPQMLDLQGICIIHSISGLGMGFSILAIINLSDYLETIPCHLMAYVMYFSFLYSFFWLNVLCFHIWRQVINPQVIRSVEKWSLYYHIYGIGTPLFLLTFLIFVNYTDIEYFRSIHPGIGQVSCWFESENGRFIYFYGPMVVLLLVNIILFLWTTIVLWTHSKNCSKTKILKYRLKMYVKLFFIMGITWIFEVISALLENYKWIWYITDALNALQGLIIFLILVVLRKKVIRSLANRKIFMFLRLPAKWREAKDSECEELEEELSLGEDVK
nr:probable G-protein coupled receptor Mth-like 10 [Leptinotarsa decemlineata]